MRFRAVWPILDNRPTGQLIGEALDDLPAVAARHRARLLGGGQFRVALSAHVPGSGRVSPRVLLFEGPAERVPARPYRQAVAR